MKFERNRFSLPDFPTTIIGLTLTFSVAAYFRFFRLAELMVFATDQGRAILAGRNILLGQLAISGPLTSVGDFHLGPFYYYLTALSLWLSHFEPIGPAAMTAGFGIVAVLMLFLFVRTYWNDQVAIASALLLAVSPLAVAQGRIAIEPSPLPFFTVLWLWLTVEWLQQKRIRWFVGTVIVALLAMQLNFSAVVLLPITAFLWLIRTPRLVPARKTLIMATASLFLVFAELYKSGKGPITAPDYFSRMWLEMTSPTSLVLAVVLFAVFLLGLWRIHLHGRQQDIPAMALFSLAIFSFFAFLLKHVSGDHALALIFPVAPLIIAVGFEPFMKRASHFGITVLVLLFLLLGIQSNTYVFFPVQKTLADHQAVVRKIIELSGGQPYNFLYRGHLDIYDAADDHYLYLLWLAGHPPADSARIELKDEYREPWLLERGTGERTIILYYPWSEADRYPSTGKRIRFEDVILETMDD